MALSNIQKIIVEKGVCVSYITGSHNNNKTFYYVGIEGNKMPDFIRALKAGSVELTKWGTIITSGYGEPSKELRAIMKEKFHCSSEHAINLLA